jgi:hypothetical protein
MAAKRDVEILRGLARRYAEMAAQPSQDEKRRLPYGGELAPPRPNIYGATRKELWGHFAAQEMTLISPTMHEEFILEYQLPIMNCWGRTAYGCCEDLTSKIDMLRQVPNLRVIAVAPRADSARCAEQIGRDYVLSWRPNPTNMICAGFDEALIRRTIIEGLAKTQGCVRHIHLKDVETVQGDPTRMRRWVSLVKDVISKA